MNLRAALFASLALLVWTSHARAQSSPNLTYGQVPTAAQWNSYFAAKEDYSPLNVLGPGASILGDCVVWNNATGSLLADSGSPCSNIFLSGTPAAGQIATWATSNSLLGTSTPNLGTPSAGILTNATGLPVSTGLSGLGTGVAAALALPSTGTGGLVRSTSPTIASPTMTGTTAISGPVSSQIGTSILASGATCNNTTDDAATLNTWLSALPQGTTVIIPPGSMCLIGSANLRVPNSIAIVGSGNPFVMLAGGSNPTPASGFYVTAPNQIVMGYGTTLSNMDIMSSGLTANPTGAQMTAQVTAWAAQSNAGVLIPQNIGGVTLAHLFVGGFYIGIHAVSGQFSIREIYVDAVNGIVESNAGSVNTTDTVHAAPWLCINSSNCTQANGGWSRPGAMLYLQGQGSNLNVHHAFGLGFYTGFVVDNVANTTIDDVGSEWDSPMAYGTIYTGYGNTGFRFINFGNFGTANNIFANGQGLPYDIEGYAGINNARYSPPSLAGSFGVAEYYLKSTDAATTSEVTLSGSMVAGNTASITVTSTNLTVSPRTVTTTVWTGESMLLVAEDLAMRLNTDAILSGAHFYARADTTNPIVYIYWPNGNTATVTASGSGSLVATVSSTSGQGGSVANLTNIWANGPDTTHPLFAPAGTTGNVVVSGVTPFVGWLASTVPNTSTWSFTNIHFLGLPTFSGGALFSASNATDAAGIASEAPSGTGGTITFNVPWPWTPNCVVFGYGATQPSSITPSQTALAWTNASLGVAEKFRYLCDFY